jgi:hypothetical protein
MKPMAMDSNKRCKFKFRLFLITAEDLLGKILLGDVFRWCFKGELLLFHTIVDASLNYYTRKKEYGQQHRRRER